MMPSSLCQLLKVSLKPILIKPISIAYLRADRVQLFSFWSCRLGPNPIMGPCHRVDELVSSMINLPLTLTKDPSLVCISRDWTEARAKIEIFILAKIKFFSCCFKLSVMHHFFLHHLNTLPEDNFLDEEGATLLIWEVVVSTSWCRRMMVAEENKEVEFWKLMTESRRNVNRELKTNLKAMKFRYKLDL